MTAIDKITGLQRKVLELQGNVDALETELILAKAETLELTKRVEELTNILAQKTQAC